VGILLLIALIHILRRVVAQPHPAGKGGSSDEEHERADGHGTPYPLSDLRRTADAIASIGALPRTVEAGPLCQRCGGQRSVVHEQRSLVSSGAGNPGEIGETEWMDTFVVRDPDGHRIVFAATDPAKHSIDPW
jgi:hypothetical protein